MKSGSNYVHNKVLNYLKFKSKEIRSKGFYLAPLHLKRLYKKMKKNNRRKIEVFNLEDGHFSFNTQIFNGIVYDFDSKQMKNIIDLFFVFDEDNLTIRFHDILHLENFTCPLFEIKKKSIICKKIGDYKRFKEILEFYIFCYCSEHKLSKAEVSQNKFLSCNREFLCSKLKDSLLNQPLRTILFLYKLNNLNNNLKSSFLLLLDSEIFYQGREDANILYFEKILRIARKNERKDVIDLTSYCSTHFHLKNKFNFYARRGLDFVQIVSFYEAIKDNSLLTGIVEKNSPIDSSNLHEILEYYQDILLKTTENIIAELVPPLPLPEEFQGQYIELLSKLDLLNEGDTMSHCVGGYSSYLISKKCRLFHDDLNNLTLEVTRENKRLIVNQLRGYKNSLPSEDASIQAQNFVSYLEKNFLLEFNNSSMEKSFEDFISESQSLN